MKIPPKYVFMRAIERYYNDPIYCSYDLGLDIGQELSYRWTEPYLRTSAGDSELTDSEWYDKVVLENTKLGKLLNGTQVD